MYTTDYYFECHITLKHTDDPEMLYIIEELAQKFNFKVAELYKMNGEPSTKDHFMSSRSESYHELADRMLRLVKAFSVCGGLVKRYKIENILLDIKHDY